jgi:hypothetical protein
MAEKTKTSSDSAALRDIAKALLQTAERLRREAEDLNKLAQEMDDAMKQKFKAVHS